MTFNPHEYAQGILDRNKQEQKLIEQRLREARKEADKLIELLIRQAGCTRAVVFGSVKSGAVRNLHFDIDIAVWGGDIMEAQGIAFDSPFSVDIVDYELAPKHVKESIDRSLLL